MASVTDATGFSSTNVYDNLDRITRVNFSDGTYEQSVYNSCCGKVSEQRDRAGRKTYYEYDALKRLISVRDSLNRLVTYNYDANDNLIKLTDSNGNITQWEYDTLDRVTKKIYADGNYDQYTYLGSTELIATHRNCKAQTITYSYDDTGLQTSIDYPTSTDITIQYDSLNRMTNMVDSVGTTILGYNNLNQLTSADGPWANDTVSYSYNPIGQREWLKVNNTDQVSYAYDSLNRLKDITNATGVFTYSYQGASRLVTQLVNPTTSKTTYAYDAFNRLTEIHNKKNDNTNLSKFVYGYDTRDIKTYVEQTYTNATTQRINFTYDQGDQLTSAVSTETPLPTYNCGYQYDKMGNRTGEQRDNIPLKYLANNLNHYTSRSYEGAIQVRGSVNEASRVKVNGTNAIVYSDNRFESNLVLLAAGTNNLTITATDGSSNSSTNLLTVVVSSGTNFCTYDANGNMTGDGEKTYDYDDQNQLIRITKAGAWKSEFSYDGFMRRRVTKEYSWVAGLWVLDSETRYVYDGMSAVQERNGSNVVSVNYTRGLEMGGGIEGLVSSTDGGIETIYHYDGRGNVVQLSNNLQIVVGSYSYDPFGRLSSISGILSAQSYRFSTKEFHERSGLIYFGYRFYSSELGKWINRDPIEEYGGINLYNYVENSPINFIDPYGEKAGVGGAILIIVAGICAKRPAACKKVLDAITQGIKRALKKERKKCDGNEKPDKMGGEDNDFNKGKGPKKGTDEYEKLRREREDMKEKTGRGGGDNPPSGDEWY